MFDGPLPESVARLSQLQGLWLDDNMLSGDISSMFDNMTLLRALYLEDNIFHGRVDDNFLKNNTILLHVDLSNNEMTGTLPAHFLDSILMPFLELVDLNNNRLTGVLPDDIAYNSVMNFLSLYSNSIRGDDPLSWFNLDGLFHLDLSSNLLQGTIPDQIGNLTALSYLFLANNSFTPGPIPASFASLTNMQQFSLKGTLRTGSLPSWIANWVDLVLLDLDQNDFVGEVPPSYGDMTNLQFLLLNRNNIQGQLPESFSKMTNLRMILLEKNAMTGDLRVLCNLPNFQEAEGDSDGTEIIASDCAGGEETQIVCSCCNICCVSDFYLVDEGLQDEETCHGATAIAHLDPLWERSFNRVVYDFGDGAFFVDRDWIN